jgi:hypothetical protein
VHARQTQTYQEACCSQTPQEGCGSQAPLDAAQGRSTEAQEGNPAAQSERPQEGEGKEQADHRAQEEEPGPA